MSVPASANLSDCPACGFGVSVEILAETPDCPHGWRPATVPLFRGFMASEGFDTIPRETK